MIHLVFYAKFPDDLAVMKNYTDNAFADLSCISECCDYPMDVLDFLNSTRPERCVVFFDTDSISYGLEIAKKVYEINPKYRFILFCEESCDAEKMYAMGVTYFVNKPYLYTNISQCLENTIAFFSDVQNRILTLKKKTGTDVLRFSEINYIMSDKRKAIFCCQHKECEYYYKLDEVEQMLDDSFIRCHQSYIVNMKQIKLFVEEGLMLLDDTFIPISRNKHYPTKRKYMAFISGEKAPLM